MIDYSNRTTPEWSAQNPPVLSANQILVVPTNEAGRHGAGLAKWAAQNLGLKYGHYWSICGQCFGIPTKNHAIETLSLNDIRIHVERFLYIAEVHFPEKIFIVPAIGCGLAGYTPEQIAPLFKDAIDLPNVHLPKRFWEVLLKD